MRKELLKFGDVEIETNNFHSSKSPIDMENVNIDKIVICNEFSCHKRVLSTPLHHCVSYSQKLSEI